ncbi:hypothetical protein GCM10014715_11290 [Streptomyces spiralis]|uniref:Uncharacterized protein n=1 Tax=Streptomyces spiralis TaxID=66376 RepID=A0A918ZN46_9ACTN|nr:hypothetical protein GCM10014715_11290 [Streptomyces spiralis]
MTARPTPSASIQEPISLGPAPAALAAVNTSAAELVTPTVTAISPAATADGGAAARTRSEKEGMWDNFRGRRRRNAYLLFHKRNVLFVEH